jgi:hypothetical protein
MKKILICMAYFGKWPEWMDLFVETCKYNPTIDWLFFTDCPAPENASVNVRYIDMSLSDFGTLVSSKLDISIQFSHAYKICDFKLAYGVIFEDYSSGYDYIGFGDLDVLYGSMRTFLTDDVLIYDLLSFHDYHISGHLCLMKNTTEITRIFQLIPEWKFSMEDASKYHGLDEQKINFFTALPYSIYFKESFNTPLSPLKPWRNGGFSFPCEWYWNRGVLTNNLDVGCEFLYFHFMRYKSVLWMKFLDKGGLKESKKLVCLDYRDMKNGLVVTTSGFYPFKGKFLDPDKMLEIKWIKSESANLHESD